MQFPWRSNRIRSATPIDLSINAHLWRAIPRTRQQPGEYEADTADRDSVRQAMLTDRVQSGGDTAGDFGQEP